MLKKEINQRPCTEIIDINNSNNTLEKAEEDPLG